MVAETASDPVNLWRRTGTSTPLKASNWGFNVNGPFVNVLKPSFHQHTPCTCLETQNEDMETHPTTKLNRRH